MAREFMPKSSALMPYVVVNRDAAVAGVFTVDGEGGSVDLTGKYVQITNYNQRVGSLETQVTTNTGDITNLKTAVTSINGSITSINTSLSNKAAKGANSDITSLTALSGPLRLGGDAVNAYDAVTLRQLQASSGGSGGATLNGVMNNNLGAVEWFNGSRAKLWPGRLASDGQLVLRSDYPDLWNAVNSGMFSSTDDTNWQATPTARGAFSTGNGSTNFRLPDLNGVWTHPTDSTLNSIPGLFLRGDGNANNGSGSGVIRRDAAPNITGSIYPSVPGVTDIPTAGDTGSLTSVAVSNTALTTLTGFTNTQKLAGIAINANRSSASYGRDSTTEVRPNSVKGIWVIRVSGAFTSANTNFNVINGDTTSPANGTLVYGGDVKSVYQIGGVDTATAAFRAKYNIGGAKTLELRVSDSSSTSTWTMPTTSGQLFGSGDMENTPWINASLLNGWTVFSGRRCVYRKVLGRVYLHISMAAGDLTDGIVVFNLPAGYRPLFEYPFPVVKTGGATTPGALVINPDGNCAIYGMTGASRFSLSTSFDLQ